MRTSEQLLADILAATIDAIRAAKNIISEVGESAKGIDDKLLNAMPGVPWKAVKGMRDKVVHDYPELDLDVLWAGFAPLEVRKHIVDQQVRPAFATT